ncbi:Udp-glycosyltransferase 74f2 [Thalictrum thalictroides]|uniref:Glycosyltransferase n=1 Tax=Thalictrum thalictroides TaxID=46969 RepID=A0A7J6X4Q2_THATH|nr:Udp-glycosyltransferase 74f2 [Thalictrum thalictroides]
MEEKAHVLILPFPSQGHINPMLQFGKRLASKGIKATLLVTNFITKSMQAEKSSVGVETISDGYDESGFAAAESAEAYLISFAKVGSRTLTELIKKQESEGYPVSCVVYDAFLPWALDVAREFGMFGAAFFTQSCAVNNIYYYFHDGELEIPDADPSARPNVSVTIPGLPSLKLPDLPSFFYVVGQYPAYFQMVLNQYSNVEKADWVFVNTFQELEVEVVEWMAKLFPLRTIGPTIPSMYLDKRLKDDTDYGLNLYKPDSSICMNWLNDKPIGSVVYIAFGSMAELGAEQMEELAWGLKRANSYFLWVVRASEERKLPAKFKEETSEKGLVVNWSPQLDVLAHQAIGCFVTHCGWNSTLEALSLGVPMVGLPQWTDQPTNAKFIEDIWGVGIKASVDEKCMVRREELEICIRHILEGDRGIEIKKKAIMLKELAQKAMDEQGSSDKNIDEFVYKLQNN